MEAIRPTLPGEADTDAVSPPSPLNTDLPPRGRTRPSVASPSVRGGSGARTAGPAIAITHHNKA